MAAIGVLGPGGVGGLLAARFGAAGHDVAVVASERTAAEITARGLRFQAPDTAINSRPVARPYLAEPVDVLFVAVKATGLLEALRRVPASVVGDAPVVPLLNGVDHLALLRASYPTVIAASIAVEATRHQPGVIQQVSGAADLVVAREDLAELIREAGLKVTVEPDERVLLWRKLAFLAPFALLTTGANAAIGEARTLREAWLRPLVDEAAAASGVDVNTDAVEAALRTMDDTAQSSMLRDFRTGRELELDAIAGPVVRELGPEGAPTTLEAVRTILDALPVGTEPWTRT
ncbi:2-dehydropantoate 2-reductase [Actinosynnema sp. NPDC020468]|uniref:ketopantoate reductase family protein n=1 Tax=Actinosynnema sp. NPDC020468 TaxID=3154488 RepID=UPI003406A848